MYTLNCNGKLVVVDKPQIMGILNITPDSFYKGFLDAGMPAILSATAQMITEGADIIDIGGQSTRPGAIPVRVEEEMQRVIPVIKALVKSFPQMLFSIDTYFAAVAKAAVEAGAGMVNDIGAGNLDADMIKTVGRLNVPYCCMHMLGTPQTMQQNPIYENMLTEISGFFYTKIEDCLAAGIKDVIIDPGFGFGKTSEQNLYLLKELAGFTQLNKPILVGLSRKKTICQILEVTPQDALNGTTILNTIALLHGADILRVHDVREAVEARALVRAMKGAMPN